VDAAHGPGGYAAAALFLGGEEQQHGQMALEKCTAQASTSKIFMVRAQYALRGSCLRTFWFSLWSIPACLRCHVPFFLRCHVGRKMWAAQSTPANPQPPPRVVLPAELNYRGACEMFQFVCKREFVSWACMVYGSHKRRERGCFLATEIPPCRTPMSPIWVMDVRNRLISPRQFQRTIKHAVSYYLSRICHKTENMGGGGVTPGGT
jgi:hypothetical protein